MPRHHETRFLSFDRAAVFDVVADVAQYPEFLPWCVAARVRDRQPESFEADLVIGWKMMRETYTSRVHVMSPDEVRVEYLKGPFAHLENWWKFHTAPGGCNVEFFVDFAFQSKGLENLITPLFFTAVQRMSAAFEARVIQLYDKIT